MSMMDDNFTAETSDAGAKMTEALDVVVAAAKDHVACLWKMAQQSESESGAYARKAKRVAVAIAVLNGEA